MVHLKDKNAQIRNSLRVAAVTTMLFICSLLFGVTLQAATVKSAEPITDLRILVDVSGSMKKNDPKNLRRDALRLLIGMVPETSRVGIWSFGKYVNMQVKPDFATKKWKVNARKEANTIHSLGQYTNIEDTLTKSSWDWRRPDPKWDRHMILLTDGMVDISKDSNKDKKSRQNILGKIVAKLSAANVKIHTVALSEQADHDLLKTLSKKTSGWYESVESAEMLQRLFLRLFEKTNKMDSLPLNDNLFDVDKNISDMTLLVFRSASGKKTKVIRPDHTVLEYKKPTKGVEWFQDKSFDIITIRKPITGKWKLDADIDKDNRVKVISNLKLRVDPLPTEIIENESVKLKASIITKDGLLNDKEILGLTEVISKSVNSKGKEVTQALSAAKIAGQYEALLEGTKDKGTLQIILKVNSPTFKRESRHEIKIHDNPVNLKVSATTKGFLIDVHEDPNLIQTGTLQLALRIEGNKGAYYVTKSGAHHWQAVLDNSFAGKQITIDATANRIGNTTFKSRLYDRLPEAMLPPKDPLTISIENDEQSYMLKTVLEDNILQTGTLTLSYNNAKDASPVIIPQASNNIWEVALQQQDSGKMLIVNATGNLLNGEKFSKDYKVEAPEFELEKSISEEPDVSKNESIEEEQQKDEEQTEAVEEDETSITIIIIALILSNIILFGGAYLGYRYWKKKNQPIDAELDAEEDANTDKEVDEPKVTESEDTDSESSESNKGSDDEDFSAQRRESTSPEEVDLDLGEEPDDEDEKKSDDAGLIDKASADDLPDFDVDLDTDMTEEETKEETKEKPNE